MLFFLDKKNITNNKHMQKEEKNVTDTPPVGRKYNPKKGAPYAALNMQASLTVEASIALPLFIAGIVALIFFLSVMQQQLHIQKALYNQITTAAGNAYYVNVAKLDNTVEGLMEAEYVKSKVISELGKENLDKSFIVNGSKGLHLNITTGQEDGIIDAAVQYTVQIPFDLLGIGKLGLVSRARCHTWIGNTTDNTNTKSDIVYMTSSGTVYHLYKDCSYIVTNTEKINVQDVPMKRNADGSKYYPCQSCCHGTLMENATVYITEYGSRYHIRVDCPNLHSNIFAVDRTKAEEKYKMCSKCRERGEK